MLLDAGIFGVQLGLHATGLRLWLQIFKEAHDEFIGILLLSIEKFYIKIFFTSSAANA